jgi:chromatin segregation and condensation protein Rec8/ScpA/Scc1 (kleisin family)
VEESDIIREIRESLRKELRRDGRFEGYAEYLVEREESRDAVLRRRRSRADQLGIDTKKNITPKNTLENQITRIIKEATASIRQQAAFIDWHDIKFELRIKPQLPYLIHQAWAKDPETS